MLVLSRHKDEAVTIGDNVKVTVVDIRGDKVRLGFDAPSEVPVHRKEVFDVIKENETLEGKVDDLSRLSSKEQFDEYLKREDLRAAYDSFKKEPSQIDRDKLINLIDSLYKRYV